MGFFSRKQDPSVKEASDITTKYELFMYIFDSATGHSSILIKELNKHEAIKNIELKENEISNEFIFLYLYLLDFILLSKLNPEKRLDIFGGVIQVAIKVFKEHTTIKDNFEDTFWNSYKERAGFYSSIPKLIDENPKGTLFWEYGKTIAHKLDKTMDIRVIMTTQTLGLDFLNEISKRIEKLA